MDKIKELTTEYIGKLLRTDIDAESFAGIAIVLRDFADIEVMPSLAKYDASAFYRKRFASTISGEDMAVNFEHELRKQMAQPFPGINPDTARHELYGFMVALCKLGIYDPDKCLVSPDHFIEETLSRFMPWVESLRMIARRMIAVSISTSSPFAVSWMNRSTE